MYQKVLTGLNSAIANEGEESTFWLLNLIYKDYPINMTMTSAPVLDHTTDLIEVHFDGRFVEVADLTNKGIKNTEW